MNQEFQLGEVTNMLNQAPYFVEYIRQFLVNTYGSRELYRGGLSVYTSLNMDFQTVAQNTIKENLRLTDKRYGYRGPLKVIDLSRDELDLQNYLLEINEFQEEGGPAPGSIIKGLVKRVRPKEAVVMLGREEGIIDLKDMAWARKPNVKIDGKWTKISNAREVLSPGDLIEVKILGTRPEDEKRSLALEQEPKVQGGLISLDPTTGHIKAMVGGYDFSKSQFNRAVQAIRQPGSAFKPIIYSAAIRLGYSPASIIIDSPIIFKEKEDAFDKWKPVNFEKKFYGPTPLRAALTHSRNIVTVKLLQSIGVNPAIQMARDLGITTHLEENLSIALGSSGVSLLQLTSAYATFANTGNRIEPTAVRFINNRAGEILYTGQPEVQQVISSGVAYTITNLLQSVVENGTAQKVKALGRPVAGKTGTTNNYVDAWFIGFTPGLATGVWVGKDTQDPLGHNETGSRAAIPIWLQYMKEVVQGTPIKNFPVSDEITFSKILPETGQPANFKDPDAKFEIFLQDAVSDMEPEFRYPSDDHTF